MAHVKDSILINASVDKVNAVVSDPHTWETWITGMSDVGKISGDGGAGTAVEHRMALMWGMRRPATTKVTEVRHDPDGSTFWRWEQAGTVSARWTCHHQPRDGRTQVTTELDYTMPWGVFGKLCDILFAASAQKRAMRRSLESIKRLAEVS